MAEGKLRRHFTKEEVVVDSETGEVLTTKKHFTAQTSVDTFYMTFIGALSGFYQLKSVVDIKVLAALCERAEMDTGKIALSKEDRETVGELVGCSVPQVTNAIASLKRKDLLTGSRGFYQINPSVFWRGSLASRQELLESGELSFVIDFSKEEK